LEVIVDLARRCIDTGMTLRAPEDRKSTTAKVNWLLRQIRIEHVEDLYIRMHWPGKSAPTQHLVEELRADVKIATEGKEHLAPTGFFIFESKQLGGRFTQQTNFIAELEKLVPAFYGNYGSKLTAWKKPAPQLKTDKSDASDVSTEAISEEADSFESRS